MKRLVRMLLVNWYRIEQETIEIRGHTALIGPNASGKSSLLDAVQAVLVGGHKEWWRPNASAGEKSTRSLRDYCLGVVRDPDNQDLSREFRPRQQSITYLVLVFHEGGGEPVSVGLALHARLEESGEQIDGRFIARGLDLVLSDLTDRSTDGEVTPKPWPRMREELRSRAGSRLILEASPEKFQQQICAVLSDGRRFLDRRRFLRAFRNAITFAPIKNVSDFVRSHILEERDIQVKSLQQALRNYREIRKRTEEAERREKALADIDGLYRKAEQAEQLLLSWRWVEQEAAFNALEAELEPVRESIEKRTRELAELADEMQRLDQAWALADEQLQEATKRLAQTDVEQQRQTIRAERTTAETLFQHARGKLEEAGRGLRLVHRVLDHAKLFDDKALEGALLELLPQLQGDEDLMPDTWPLDAAGVVTRLGRVQPLLAQTLRRQKEMRGDTIAHVRDLERTLTDLRERIKRLETGGSDLSPATLRLQAMLSEHGIEAVPLCDRVEVADEAWRDSLEAFLGGHREALLVDPGEVRDAIALYRSEGKRLGIHGSRIVNTRKSGEWEHRAAPGSLAEVIRSEDPHAIAYINRRAGNVLRVETEQDLLVHERAITSDGMLATGGAITRLRPLDPMLGRAARERTLEALKRRFADQSDGYATAKSEGERLERFIDEILSPFKGQVEGLPDLVTLSEQRQTQQAQIKHLDAQEKALQDDTEYRRLKENVESAKTRRDEADSQRTGARARNTELQKAQQADQTKLAGKQGESQIAAEQRRQLEAVPGFDAQSAGERLEELEGQMLLKDEGPDSWRALRQEAQQRGARQGTAMRNRRAQARDDLKEYLAQWPSDRPPALGLADDHLPMSTWVLEHLTELKETELAQYKRKAETALDEAEAAFRADFVGKLQENLHLLETQRRELNANLRRRPFHGQYYSFIKKPDKELEPVLHWVESWTPDQSADVGGLFDMTNDPSHPHHEGIARVKALLLAAGDKDPSNAGWDERLSDYRRYYHFDVRMTDDQDGQKNAELLSRRLGKGSGGEHQSPFYVAIGAALAAAYRIERDEQGGFLGGLALAVFDEAFSKLDLQNTVSALGFLDELGLQVLLAAPDEKYGQIAEHVDTIVSVYRDGGNVYIDTEYIKPAARRALAADNPAQRPAAHSSEA